MIYTIYRAVNLVNGKSYVGFTGNFIRRKVEHCNLIGNCRLFVYALRKYGVENFQWYIEYETPDRDFAQTIMEPYCISLYASYCKKNGYNLSKGGEGNPGADQLGEKNSFFGRKHTQETKDKIRQRKLGRIQPAHEKESQRKAQLGHVVSEETKEKLRKKNMGTEPWNKGKVGVYTEESNRRRSETEKKTKAKS